MKVLKTVKYRFEGETDSERIEIELVLREDVLEEVSIDLTGYRWRGTKTINCWEGEEGLGGCKDQALDLAAELLKQMQLNSFEHTVKEEYEY